MTNFASLINFARTAIKPAADIITNPHISISRDLLFTIKEVPALKECYGTLFADAPQLELLISGDVYEPDVNRFELYIKVYDRFCHADTMLNIPLTTNYTSEELVLLILEELCAMLDKEMKGDNS